MTLTGSWRTTISGLVAAVAGFVVSNPQMFAKWPWASTLAGFIMTGGLAGIGVFSKDSAVHSTTAEVQVATIEKKAEDVKEANKVGN